MPQGKVLFSIQGGILTLGELISLDWKHDPEIGMELSLKAEKVDSRVYEILVGANYMRQEGSERLWGFPVGYGKQQPCTIIAMYEDQVVHIVSLSEHLMDAKLENDTISITAWGRRITVATMTLVADNDH